MWTIVFLKGYWAKCQNFLVDEFLLSREMWWKIYKYKRKFKHSFWKWKKNKTKQKQQQQQQH